MEISESGLKTKLYKTGCKPLEASLMGYISYHDQKSKGLLKGNNGYYTLICGPSYGILGFEDREEIRTALREKLGSLGIHFLEYTWVWDEDDRCLLLVGEYEKEEDANKCMIKYELLGFKTCIRTSLPGGEDI
jgi:hypothetical protein